MPISASWALESMVNKNSLKGYSLSNAAQLEDASASYKHIDAEEIPVLGDDHQGVPITSAHH